MATYASLADFKEALKITGTTQDAFLTSLLERTEALINRYLGVDTLLSSTVNERLKITGCNISFILLKKRPVTAISKINGVSVALVENIDYIVENLRRITFVNPQILLDWQVLGTFSIEYTAGYATAPKDIVLCEIMLASNLYATTGTNNAYQSYAIGDEKVVFKTSEEHKEAMALLNPYRLV